MSKETTAMDLVDRLLFFEDLAAQKSKQSGNKARSKVAGKEIGWAGVGWTIDLIFCEHCYNETGRGNPLFALEAYKIHRELNLPIDHKDWFMVHNFLFSLGELKLLEDGVRDSKEIKEEVFRVFHQGYMPSKQKGRSLFFEYLLRKRKLEIFKKVRWEIEGNKKKYRENKGKINRSIVYSKLANEYGRAPKTIENYYYEVRKILLHKTISP